MDASFFIPSPNAAATSVRAAHSFITRDEQLGSASTLAGAFSSLVPPRQDKNGIKQPTSVVSGGKEREERTSRSFFMGRMQKFQPQEAKRALYFLPPSTFRPHRIAYSAIRSLAHSRRARALVDGTWDVGDNFTPGSNVTCLF